MGMQAVGLGLATLLRERGVPKRIVSATIFAPIRPQSNRP